MYLSVRGVVSILPGLLRQVRANVAQHPRDPPDHVEDRGVHGNQRAAGAAARHPGQDVPDQVQGPLSPKGTSQEFQQRPRLRSGGWRACHAPVL